MLTFGSNVKLRVLKMLRPNTASCCATSCACGFSSSIVELSSCVCSRRRASALAVPVKSPDVVLVCCSYSFFTRSACSRVTPRRASSVAMVRWSLPCLTPSLAYSNTCWSVMPDCAMSRGEHAIKIRSDKALIFILVLSYIKCDCLFPDGEGTQIVISVRQRVCTDL